MSSFIVRDPRFSMSMVEATEVINAPHFRVSYVKQLERRIIGVWKLVTRTTRKKQRSSFLHPDFIAVTSRRRSSIHPQLYRYQQ